jgi:hypothetical protein
MEAAVETSQEEVKTTDFEANPEEKESVAEHQEVPSEEAAVGTIGALEDRYGDRYLVACCLRQTNKLTEGDDGSRQKLGRLLTRRGIPALRKGCGRRGPGKAPGNRIRGRSRR